MAIGDVTQKKLLQKALDTTATNSIVTGAANKVTMVTSISICNTGSSSRTFYGYLYGNLILVVSMDAASCEILTGLDYVLQAGETMSFKQDAGTDLNIAVMGLEEAMS